MLGACCARPSRPLWHDNDERDNEHGYDDDDNHGRSDGNSIVKINSGKRTGSGGGGGKVARMLFKRVGACTCPRQSTSGSSVKPGSQGSKKFLTNPNTKSSVLGG